MELQQKGLGDAVLAGASGRIDLSNADAFTTALSAVLIGTKSALNLDLSKVDYISSSGLRTLMITLKASKTGFGVAALQPMPEIFSIARLSLMIPVFPTTRDAVAKLAPDALVQSNGS